MCPSIPQDPGHVPEDHWQVHAGDPMALTRLLDLPELIVTGLEYDAIHERLFVLCAHAAPVALCPTCHQASPQIHDYHRRTVRDLAMSGNACYLQFAARRFYCGVCQCPFREELAWLSRCSRLTQRFRAYLFEQCRATTVQAVCQKEHVGYKTLQRLYYALAEEHVAVGPPAPVRQLGIDEFAIKKGHGQFALALSDLQRGQVIAVLPERKKETLQAYLANWTDAQRDAVEEVAMDLWEPYAQAVAADLPKARIVADRFHVMSLLNDHVTAARRQIQRDVPQESKAVLKGGRWLLVRNEADLSAADKDKLEGMFRVSEELRRLHRLKEDFRQIFETQQTPEEATAQLQGWIEQVQTSGIVRLAKFVATLRNRWNDVLNYFHNRLTSGAVEGLNNKVKLIKRAAYGFRNFEHFALRIRVECDGVT